MLKWLRKNIYWLVASTFLLLLTLFLFSKTEPPKTISFRLLGNDYTADISVHESNDGNFYVFLPSYAEMGQLESVVPQRLDASLGGIPLVDAMSCEMLEPETPYAYCVNGQYVADLLFYRSANVATLFIETASGGMERIHEDKNYSEPAIATIVSDQGEIECYDCNALLEGRGNATWSYEKRPYLIKLSTEKGLFGMNAATKWVLLANAQDETNLNNKLALDLAKNVDFYWSPDCVYIDLYLNGEYNGLYLLTEKVETGESRLNIDLPDGDFLCKIDLEGRWSTLTNPVLTDTGRTVEISESNISDDEQKEILRSYINQIEEIIFSDEDLNTIDSFDLDSWVRRYLIDEISGNIDSDLASSYFYCSNGVFYAGPIWDYDMAFGNSYRNLCPMSFIAKNMNKSDSFVSPYYASLYTNESFHNRMTEIYEEEFLPILNRLLETDLPNLEKEIEVASKINSIRWNSMYDSKRNVDLDIVCTVDELERYLESRISFLNSAWLDGVEYCTVQFEVNDSDCYYNVSVEKGTRLKTSYVDVVNTNWVNNSTGTVFDFSEPIMVDMILSEQVDSVTPLATRYYVLFLSIIAIVLLFFALVHVDLIRFHKRRSKTHGIR